MQETSVAQLRAEIEEQLAQKLHFSKFMEAAALHNEADSAPAAQPVRIYHTFDHNRSIVCAGLS